MVLGRKVILQDFVEHMPTQPDAKAKAAELFSRFVRHVQVVGVREREHAVGLGRIVAS